MRTTSDLKQGKYGAGTAKMAAPPAASEHHCESARRAMQELPSPTKAAKRKVQLASA